MRILRFRLISVILIAFLVYPAGSACAEVHPTKSDLSPNVEQLTPLESHLVKTTLKILKPAIDQKKLSGAMNLLTFEELYSPLSHEQKNFLDEIQKIDPEPLGSTAHSFSSLPSDALFVKLPEQKIRRSGLWISLPRQYLPQEVYYAYQEMMMAMEKDLEKVLYVESGYRSPAYQLYLFLYYLPKHGYSIRENNRFIALPGHSEHGAPEQQAIDFINEEGINGEDNPEEFEALPEYRWLAQHAKEFEFVLSYPRNNPWGTSFEPWHWHFEQKDQRHKTED